MFNYFEECKTQDEFKQRYRELAKQNHPDLGGCSEAMKAINDEYEKEFRENYRKSGAKYEGVDVEDLLNEDRELREKLYAVLGINGIDIELVGTWIWIEGDSRPVKDVLKRNGFRWARKKSAWYFHTGAYRKRGKKSFTLDEIRSRHGSSIIKNGSRRKAIA